jgi:hypothetical protein
MGACVNYIMTICVDDLSILIGTGPEFREVIKMDMTVDKIAGLEYVHKPEKGLEAPVALVRPVMDPPGGGMGKEYVQVAAPEDAVKEQAGDEAEHFHIHLEFGVLVLRPVVAHGAPEPRYDKTLLVFYL